MIEVSVSTNQKLSRIQTVYRRYTANTNLIGHASGAVKTQVWLSAILNVAKDNHSYDLKRRECLSVRFFWRGSCCQIVYNII